MSVRTTFEYAHQSVRMPGGYWLKVAGRRLWFEDESDGLLLVVCGGGWFGVEVKMFK